MLRNETVLWRRLERLEEKVRNLESWIDLIQQKEIRTRRRQRARQKEEADARESWFVDALQRMQGG